MRKTDDIQPLDNIFYSVKRHPKIKILLFDRSDDLYKIVLGNYSQVPKDITKYLLECNITENWESGATANLTFIMQDDLTPYHFCGRPIIKILETDKRILNEIGDVWFTMFLGPCIGQPGFNAFDRSETRKITVSATDRTFFYNEKYLSTENFDKGEDFGDIGVEIAINTEYGMSLQREEVLFGKQYYQVAHEYFSIKEVSFFEGLNNLFFILNYKCQFNTEGLLCLRDMDIEKEPSRIYQNYDCIKDIKWKNENANVYNQIRIIGLDSEITKQTYPRQIIANVSGHIGFFMRKYSKVVFFSEDRSHKGEYPEIEEFEVNGWLGSIAKGDAEVIQNDEYSCVLRIKTPYNGFVFYAFLTGYVAFFTLSIFDFFGISKILHVAAAIWLCAGLAIMQQLGNFSCSISCIPYQMLYKEIVGIATWSDINDYEIRELEIQNHLINTQALADELAKRELDKEKVKEHSREIIILNDPTMEPYDIIETSDGSRYLITNITRNYNRNGISFMNLSCILIKSESDYA